MSLRKFEGRHVRLVDTDGEVFIGYVSDYIFPEDNEPEGVEGIIVDTNSRKYPVEFRADEIQSITTI